MCPEKMLVLQLSSMREDTTIPPSWRRRGRDGLRVGYFQGCTDPKDCSIALLQDNPDGPELGAGDFAVTIACGWLTARHPAAPEERWRPAQGKIYRPIARPRTWP